MKAQVVFITNKFDWGMNAWAETTIEIEVDDDVVHKLKFLKLKDMNAIRRGKRKTDVISLVIEFNGYNRCNTNGLASLPHHLYNIAPGTKRINASHPLDYTRKAFGIL